MDKIILYSKTSCPKCKILKQKLTDSKLDFEIVEDVEKMTHLGIDILPVLDVNGDTLKYNNAIKWINGKEDKN